MMCATRAFLWNCGNVCVCVRPFSMHKRIAFVEMRWKSFEDENQKMAYRSTITKIIWNMMTEGGINAPHIIKLLGWQSVIHIFTCIFNFHNYSSWHGDNHNITVVVVVANAKLPLLIRVSHYSFI